MSKKILTNFFQIDLYHPDSFDLKVFPYSREKLQELRDNHNETHSFFRIGEYIFGAWMEGEQIAGDQINVIPSQTPETISSLIKHLFFRAFIRNITDIVPLDFHPLSFISKHEKHDAIREYLPNSLKGIISFDRQYEIHLRSISIPYEDLKYGFTINVRHRWNISENIAQLSRRGINLEGFNVVQSEPIPGKEGILAPSESYMGDIVDTNGELVVINSNDGFFEFPKEKLYLRRNTYDIKKLLSKLLDEDQAERIISHAKRNSQIKSDFKDYYSKIRGLVKSEKGFSNWRYYCKDEFEFVFSGSSEVIHQNYLLENNKFIFDYGTGSASKSIIHGLKDFGPFDSSSFRPKSPSVLVVCNPSSRGGFSTAMGALRNGIPSSSYFKSGMKDLFRLQDINFDFGELPNQTAEGYLKTIKDKLAENESYDLVIVEGTDKDEYPTPKDNPYYVAKAYLMSQGIPVQALQVYNTRNKSNLQYILAPLALQIYSKMGGVPWVLPSSNDVDWEIIVGISHTYLRANAYSGGEITRIVGLTTFFSSDGNLLFSDNSKATDFDSFFDELLLSLKSSVHRLSQNLAWQKGQTVRFVFHVFKPMKDREIEVVKKLISEFESFEIKFAFIQVVDNHPFIIFDKQSKGKRRKSNVNKEFVPLRGVNFILNEHECLLQTLGAGELFIPGHAPSSPVLIRLHEDSTFKDLHHITQQVYKFTHHSWRSLNPTHMPVTLFYAKMIARLLGKMRKVRGFDPESLLSLMRYKKWFL